MSKFNKHTDLDSEIWPVISPISLFWKLLAVCVVFILLVSWTGVIAVWAMGLIAFEPLYCVWVPLILFIVLLGLPALLSSRRAALQVLDTMAMSLEAWAARAGFSIDLNNDRMIGHVEARQIETPAEVRPIMVNGTATLLAQQAAAIAGIDALAEDEPAPPARPRLWELPAVGGRPPVKIAEAKLEEFLDGIFVHGYSRAAWVDAGKMNRDEYDGLIGLLEQTRLLVDRKPGSAGRLAVKTSKAARSVLGLSTN